MKFIILKAIIAMNILLGSTSVFAANPIHLDLRPADGGVWVRVIDEGRNLDLASINGFDLVGKDRRVFIYTNENATNIDLSIVTADDQTFSRTIPAPRK